MKKVLNGKVNYYGKPARIACTVTDENGYISITSDITPYRCRTAHACGCLHEEIARAFPALRPFMWLHLANLDGSVTYEMENSLYLIANGDEEKAQDLLHCTDDEIRELSALVRYGLHRKKSWYKYQNGRQAYEVNGEDSRRIYAQKLEGFNLRARRRQAINKLYSLLND